MNNYISKYMFTENSGIGIKRICVDSRGLYCIIERFKDNKMVDRTMANLVEGSDGKYFFIKDGNKYILETKFEITKG